VKEMEGEEDARKNCGRRGDVDYSPILDYSRVQKRPPRNIYCVLDTIFRYCNSSLTMREREGEKEGRRRGEGGEKEERKRRERGEKEERRRRERGEKEERRRERGEKEERKRGKNRKRDEGGGEERCRLVQFLVYSQVPKTPPK
jgi:hypothetical protein